MKIKGLVFDLDGVITETAHLHYLAWKKEVSKLDLSYSEEENEALKGLSRIDTLKAILRLKNYPALSEAQLIQMAESKNQKYVAFLNQNLDTSAILPGVKKILAQAKKMGMQIAIASSSKNASLILSKIGLNDYFDFIVDPHMITKGKPDPEIFLAAVAGLKLQPAECLGFEDAVAGVVGLKKAGIITIAVTHNAHLDFSMADYQINELTDLDLTQLIAQIESA